jgi:predicted TPR repeat methyltransferase
VPADLVTKQFDDYADEFDDKLVERLGYGAPGRIAEMLARHMPANNALDVLDIGCGTGLCAPHLRDYARHLAGVDLAPRMVEKARARGLYDVLEAGDLLPILERERERWGLIVAGDVLAYFGGLESLFDAISAALKPSGYFAFTTEALDCGAFTLRGSGRYAHSRDYIAGLVAQDFQIVDATRSMIRREGGRPLDGDFILLRRKDD